MTNCGAAFALSMLDAINSAPSTVAASHSPIVLDSESPDAAARRLKVACTSGVTVIVNRILGVGVEVMVQYAPVCTSRQATGRSRLQKYRLAMAREPQ